MRRIWLFIRQIQGYSTRNREVINVRICRRRTPRRWLSPVFWLKNWYFTEWRQLVPGSGTFDECGSKTQRFGTKTATRYPSIRTRLGSPNCRAWPGSTSRDKSCHCTIQRQKAVDDIFVFCRFADPREILKFCNDLKFRYQLAETSSQGKEGSLL